VLVRGWEQLFESVDDASCVDINIPPDGQQWYSAVLDPQGIDIRPGKDWWLDLCMILLANVMLVDLKSIRLTHSAYAMLRKARYCFTFRAYGEAP
jgi:hypothetical protein